jgi:hypothetical protein
MADVRKTALNKLDAQVIEIEINVLTTCHKEFKSTKDPRFAEVTLKAADRISKHRGLNAPDKQQIDLHDDGGGVPRTLEEVETSLRSKLEVIKRAKLSRATE